MDHASRPGGASHLRGPRHGVRRAARKRRAWLFRREHTTQPAGPATRALPAGRAARALPGRGYPEAGRTSLLPIAVR